MINPCGLTDDELKATLLKYGFKAGPIVATTRPTYERKLQNLLEPTEHRQNGDTRDEDQYSEEDLEDSGSEQGILEENQVDDIQVHPQSSPLGGGGDPDSTHSSRSFSITQMEEPITDVLMEMFPETEPTPTGISATRRRPIKGAAGRPVSFKYPDLLASPMAQQRQAVEHRLVPLWVQILVFLGLCSLIYVLYAAMDNSLDNPFVSLLDNLSLETATETEGMLLHTEH